MPDLAELNLIIRSEQVQLANQRLDQFANKAKIAERQGVSLADRLREKYNGLGNVLAKLGLAFSAISIAKRAFESTAEFERVHIAFESLTGSMEKGVELFEKMRALSRSTSFDFTNLTHGAKLMISLGINADEAANNIKVIADAASAFGGTNYELQRINLAFSQMAAKGKLSAQEMTHQLAEVGIPAWRILAGVIGTDVPTAMKMAEKGQLDGLESMRAILSVLAVRYKDFASKVAGTVGGIALRIRNEFEIVLGDVGEQLVKQFNVQQKMEGFIRGLRSVSELIKDVVTIMAGGEPHYKESARLAYMLADALRYIGVALKYIIILKSIEWAASFTVKMYDMGVSAVKLAFTLTSVLVPALTAVGVAFTAFEFGTWAYKEFSQVQTVMAKMINGVEKFWADVKYVFNSAMIELSYAWHYFWDMIKGTLADWAKSMGTSLQSIASMLPDEISGIVNSAGMAMKQLSTSLNKSQEEIQISYEAFAATNARLKVLLLDPAFVGKVKDQAEEITNALKYPLGEGGMSMGKKGGRLYVEQILDLLNELTKDNRPQALQAGLEIRKALIQGVAGQEGKFDRQIQLAFEKIKNQIAYWESDLVKDKSIADITQLFKEKEGHQSFSEYLSDQFTLAASVINAKIPVFQKNLQQLFTLPNVQLPKDNFQMPTYNKDKLINEDEASNKYLQKMQKLNNELSVELSLVGKTNDQRERAKDLVEFTDLAMKAYIGDINIAEAQTRLAFGNPEMWIKYQMGIAQVTAAVGEYRKKLDQLKAARELQKVADDTGDAFANMFTDITLGAKSAMDALSDFANEVQRLLFRQLVGQPMANAISSATFSLLRGIPGVGPGLAASANGNVFDRGLQKFAAGDIFSSSTYFRFGGGKTGEMGEDGPEAVMPLKRMPNGKLGVASEGSGGGANITMNVYTQNADSFRRSKSQIVADLRRATR